ncbi:MAG: hypothetical protein QXL85_03095 [Candidatus Bathyarchaeia archaeon]
MVIAEERREPIRSHKVVIRGVVEGYEVASLEDLKKIEDRIESIQSEINALRNQISELQKTLNATNMRLERLENFLKSFR